MRTVRSTIRKLLFVALGLAILLAAIVVLGNLWRHHKYPYGVEHVCAKQLSLALSEYARQHEGRFPTGGETPEASLSLLYPKYCDVHTLRGKAYAEEPARKLLESGRPLTPETCGWHYVDGLRLQKDHNHNHDHRIAIAWDKIGLGHNSEILPAGGHTVIFMDAHEDVISADGWEQFLAGQEPAWEAIRRGETPPQTWLPGDSP